MADEGPTKEQLIRELVELRTRVASLEALKDEHDRAIAALKEVEARYRGIFENTKDGVAVYRAVDDGQDFVIVDFNGAGERIEKTVRSDIIGRRVRDVFPGVKEFGLLEVFQRVWRTGEPEQFPMAFYEDDRIAGWRDNSVHRLPSGEIVAVYSDETDRVRHEESLHRFERIVSASREHMSLIGVNYIYQAVNDAYLAAHDKTRTEIVGRTVVDIHGERVFQELLKEKYDRCFKGETVHYQSYFDFPTMGRRWMDVAYYPYREESGAVTGVVVAARDITDMRRLEERLNHAEKMEALGTLASSLAHDFNNLLMGIQGCVSLMLVEADVTPTERERLQSIEQHVRSGSDLTKQLLGFARPSRFDTKATDLNELIHRMSTMIGRAKKDVVIQLKLGEGLWPVDVDRGQIEQVILNLVVNAWEAMPEGGDLFIETENRVLDEDYVKPYALRAGQFVRLAVSDTGIGMSEATRQRVFEPFFTTKEMGRGTGLGLTSAYSIIINHGGVINCYSEEGRGTTFTIYLRASPAAVVEREESADEILMGSETVLVVDDEDMVRQVTQEMLEKLGYAVLTASGGEEALEIYREQHDQIDLVILDMVMPRLSGGGTYDGMKAIDPTVKILLSSGYSMDSHASELLARGCDGFIQKPCDMKGLSRKVREVLDGK